jgi:hypothetical protein
MRGRILRKILSCRKVLFQGSFQTKRICSAFQLILSMEEPGEQCNIVFVVIITEPASECVCVWGKGGNHTPPPH